VTTPASVIATVRNEAGSIEPFLESLARQTRTPDEVVVVDGGSTDGTLERLRELERRHRWLRVHEAPGANISEGRNLAIARARGPLVGVTDAGTTLQPDWLERLLEPLERDGSLAVASGFFGPGGDTRLERLISTVITPQLSEISPERFLPSSRSVAFRRDWWQRVGGYPEWLNHCEDLVFDMHLKAAGARFQFVPDALVTWRARPTLRAFFRQYFNYARGDGHAHLWPRRHAVRFTAYGLGAALLVAGRRRRGARAALLIGTAAYFSKFARRLRLLSGGAGERALGLALMPAVVITGDVAKMLGYPLGLYERWRAGTPERLRAPR
jgi:glycosyltransferase involved in cell wall biosynthesis